MNELKDKDLREALRRKEALRAKPEVPADFCDSIMDEITPRQGRRPVWRWIAAAACLIILIGIGVTMAPFSRQTKDESLMAEQVKRESKDSPKPVETESTISTDGQNTPYKQNVQTVQTVRTNANSAPMNPETVVNSQYSDPNLHYAAYTPTEDSIYQAPSRMDEFIAKMAAFNEVEAVPLDCNPGSSDSLVVSTAYVFEDKQELDLFGRLLQAACWYDSKTPGYLLNFSHQQFFFTLKDLHKHEKYLWIAERIIGGRILLYSTHSPIETEVSSACYQKYREQLTHTNMSTLF